MKQAKRIVAMVLCLLALLALLAAAGYTVWRKRQLV